MHCLRSPRTLFVTPSALFPISFSINRWLTFYGVSEERDRCALKGESVGAIPWYRLSDSADSRESLSLRSFNPSTPVVVYEVLRYVMGPLGSAICFTVAVPSQHIPQPRTNAEISDNPVHNGEGLCILVSLH